MHRRRLLALNIAANIAGRVGGALLNYSFVPLYLSALGAEKFGLFAFYTTVQAVFVIADLGTATALAREVARSVGSSELLQRRNNLLKTIEIAYWVGGFLLTAVLLSLVPVFGRHWFGGSSVSTAETEVALRLMAVMVGMQLLFLFYQAVLTGLERQISINIILLLTGASKGVGGIFFLYYINPSITTLLAWYAVLTLASVLTIRALVVRRIREGPKGRVDFSAIKSIWKFSAGAFVIGVTSVILTNADKLVLSRLVSLESFGKYSIAWLVGSAPLLLAGPIQSAVYPRLVKAVTACGDNEIRQQYRFYYSGVGVFCIPFGMTIALFSSELIYIWIGDKYLAAELGPIVTILSFGSTLLAVMVIPYALQLAYAWTRLAAYINIFAIIFIIPLLILLVKFFGIFGAAFAWLSLNFLYVLVSVGLVHRRLMPRETLHWYVYGFAFPVGCSGVLLEIGRRLPQGESRLSVFLSLSIIAAITQCAVICINPIWFKFIKEQLLCLRSAINERRRTDKNSEMIDDDIP
jgi:O-antigen/teichoic acid export membrane protein